MNLPTTAFGREEPARGQGLARAAAAEQRAAERLATAIDDFFLAEEGRLDDRSRAAITGALTVTLEAIAREVAGHAARQLAGQPHGASFAPDVSATLARLWGNHVVRDRELFDELLGQVRLDLLGDALLANRAPGTQPTLMPRRLTPRRLSGLVATQPRLRHPMQRLLRRTALTCPTKTRDGRAWHRPRRQRPPRRR